MVKKINPILVQEKLQKLNLSIFSPREFQRIFGVSTFATSKFLYQHSRKKFFIKLRNGLYCLSSNIPPSFMIANKLYEPSYISLETALSFYGIIPESTYTLTSVSTRATHTFKTLGKEFSYTKIKKNFFTGYTLLANNNEKFLIAEPEKAFLDYLYMASLNKKKLNNRFNLSILDKQKLKQWQRLFNNSRINQLISNLYAN